MDEVELNLSDEDRDLISEALHRLLADKTAAHGQSLAAGLPFTERDFGIPRIQALIKRVDVE